jgi:hypothetical protein
MRDNKRIDRIISQRVGETFEAGGRTWEIRERKPSLKKPRFYIKYGIAILGIFVKNQSIFTK